MGVGRRIISVYSYVENALEDEEVRGVKDAQRLLEKFEEILKDVK